MAMQKLKHAEALKTSNRSVGERFQGLEETLPKPADRKRRGNYPAEWRDSAREEEE
jgi:hypothetical protein